MDQKKVLDILKRAIKYSEPEPEYYQGGAAPRRRVTKKSKTPKARAPARRRVSLFEGGEQGGSAFGKFFKNVGKTLKPIGQEFLKTGADLAKEHAQKYAQNALTALASAPMGAGRRQKMSRSVHHKSGGDARKQRGALVSKLMKKYGDSLGDASKEASRLKEKHGSYAMALKHA